MYLKKNKATLHKFLSTGFTVHDSASHLYHQNRYKDIKDRTGMYSLKQERLTSFMKKVPHIKSRQKLSIIENT